MSQSFYQQDADKVCEQLGAWPLKGLSAQEAKRRLEQYGPNELKAKHKVSPWRLFLSQFKDALIIVLIVAAGVSLVLSQIETEGSSTEGLLILFIVLAI